MRFRMLVAAGALLAFGCEGPEEGQGVLSGLPSGIYTASAETGAVTAAYEAPGFGGAETLIWREWTAFLELDTADWSRSRLEASLNASSLDSGNPNIDIFLNGREFFDAEAAPVISFQSMRIVREGDRIGSVAGDLQIKDASTPIVFRVRLEDAQYDPDADEYRLTVRADATVSRAAAGLGDLAEAADDEVSITVNAAFVKKDEAP